MLRCILLSSVAFFGIIPCGFSQPLASYEIHSKLIQHVFVLASDSLQGRGTGTEGEAKAANYIASQLTGFGFDTSSNTLQTQPFSLIRTVTPRILIKQGNNWLVNPWHFLYTGSVRENDTLNHELRFAGYGSPSDLSQIDIRNKALVFFAENPDMGYKLATEIKAQHGNTTFFIIVTKNQLELDACWENNLKQYEFNLEDHQKQLEQKLNRLIWFNPKPTDSLHLFYCFSNVFEPMFNKTDRELEKITQHKQLGQLPTLPITCYIQTSDSTEQITSKNIIGNIPVKGSNNYLIVSAHYDHLGTQGDEIFHGADDNASGTAALIEIARAAKTFADANPNAMKQNLVFIAFSAEEMGLLGSKYYVNQPVFPLNKSTLNINIDMVGRFDEHHQKQTDYVYFLTHGANSKALTKLAKQQIDIQNRIDIDLSPDKELKELFLQGSDHYSFAEKGLPVAVFFTGLHNDYHTVNDTPTKINYKNLTEITKVISNMVIKLATDTVTYEMAPKP